MVLESIIFIPGTLCNAMLWNDQVSLLARKFEVFIADITEDSSVEDMARRILQDAPGRFHLVGFSLGGIVAMEVLRRAAHRIQKLVLLDTNPNAPTTAQIATWNKQIEAVKNGYFHKVVLEEVIRPGLHPSRQDKPNLLKQLMLMAESVGEAGFIRQLTANVHRPSGREVLEITDCPVLVIAGDEDALCPQSMQRDMVSLISNGQLHLINQCGHYSPIEQPADVQQQLDYFLSDFGNGDERT